MAIREEPATATSAPSKNVAVATLLTWPTTVPRDCAITYGAKASPKQSSPIFAQLTRARQTWDERFMVE